MGVVGGQRKFGFFDGKLSTGDNSQFTWGTYQSTGGPDGGPYLQVTGGGGATAYSSDYIEIDPSNSYQMVAYLKTISNGSSGNAAGGHVGFATYDKNKSFIDLRNCKGQGDTTLTRAASPGDTTIYVADASGWSTSSSGHQRGIILFGGQYPYSDGYSRYTVTSDAYATDAITDLGGGEYSVTLNNGLGTYSDVLSGGSYPIGTYISNGVAGGTFSYALGAPNYPSTWTRYQTDVFTGESRNSSTPFRYGTKYIRFMILRNYNRRTESPQDHVWGIGKIFFGRVIAGRNYSTGHRHV